MTETTQATITRAAEPRDQTDEPGLRAYAVVFAALTAHCLGLNALVGSGGAQPIRADSLLGPILGLVALVAAVWLIMLIVRNYAVIARIASSAYYLKFADSDHPPDWVERPARTFNNLMQLPTLFYLVCVLGMVTNRCDAAQLHLAWVFVALRALHAGIYITCNHLPSRFGSYVAGLLTLFVLWWRFAEQL